jgi:hypothetical protein
MLTPSSYSFVMMMMTTATTMMVRETGKRKGKVLKESLISWG